MASAAKRQSLSTPTPQFEESWPKFVDFPNEILIKMCGYLKFEEIIKFSRASKRTKSLCQDEYLGKINLYRKIVPIKFLRTILNHDCEYLSLQEAKVLGTNFSSKPLQLKYLELNWCQSGTIASSDHTIVEELLRYCYSLEKLSLSWLEIKPCIFSIISIQNGNTLQVNNFQKSLFDFHLSKEFEWYFYMADI